MNIFATGIDYFVKGGPIMYPLLICSIAAVAISMERYLYYRSSDSGKDFTKKFCQFVEEDDWSSAQSLTDNTKGAIAKLVTSVMNRHENFENLENFISNRAERTIDKFERNLDYLNVIVTLSPILGLLGTITGMITSFNNFNQRLDNPLAVTAGIGEALITTVFGLCISIVALCIHAYFIRRLRYITLSIEQISNTLLEAVAKHLDKAKEKEARS